VWQVGETLAELRKTNLVPRSPLEATDYVLSESPEKRLRPSFTVFTRWRAA